MQGAPRGLLMVNYLFPPVGGAGVQRNLKFARYLGGHDWQPTVLTVKEVNHYTRDPSLLSELPASVRVVRTESLDPLRLSTLLLRGPSGGQASSAGGGSRRFREGSAAVRTYRQLRNVLLFPDGQSGWVPFAIRAGIREVRRGGVDVIMGCVQPLSAAIIARRISRATGVPYLLDFRDGWLDDPYLVRSTPVHDRLHRGFEARTVTGAAAITVYGRYLADRLIERYPEVDGRVHVIPNGFDPGDIDVEPLPRPADGPARIVYTGSLYAHHERSMQRFVDGLCALDPATLAGLEVLFVGQSFDGAARMVADAGLADTVQFLGYRPHAEALGYLASADASLLFVRPGDLSSVTGKVFEYIGVERPILACVEPAGACADILRDADRADWISAPEDADALARNIERLAGQGWPGPPEGSAERYSRPFQAGQLAGILDGLVPGYS